MTDENETTKIAPTVVKWLAAEMPTDSFVVPRVAHDVRLRTLLANGNITGHMEFLRTGLAELQLTTNYLIVPNKDKNQHIPVLGVQLNAGRQEYLQIHLVRKGRATFVDDDTRKTLHCARGAAVIRRASKTSFTASVDTTDDVETATLTISNGVIDLLLGEQARELLYSKMHLPLPGLCRELLIPNFLSDNLFSHMRSHAAEDLRPSIAQMRVIGFLSAFAEYACGVEETEGALGKRKIRTLYDELYAMEGSPPSLSELARRYGASVRKLNDDFKSAYGKTIGKFLMDLRLSRARDAILHTDQAIKVIAAQHGYSHVNNFTIAFKHAFGQTPGSLRRGGT